MDAMTDADSESRSGSGAMEAATAKDLEPLKKAISRHPLAKSGSVM